MQENISMAVSVASAADTAVLALVVEVPCPGVWRI